MWFGVRSCVQRERLYGLAGTTLGGLIIVLMLVLFVMIAAPMSKMTSGLIATMHLAASMPEAPPIERFYLELEASPFGDQVNVRDGFFDIPDGPGLGLVVDAAVIDKYRVG